MQIITTHINSDFDALASMVACTFLYPGSVGYIPGHMAPEVKSFLSIHQDMLHIKARKDLVVEQVESLIVVDTNNWQRLDRLESLSDKDALEVICWDHHMQGVTIQGSEEHREEVGATVTLLLEEMQRRDVAFTPMHATLFLLGIYDDTGCLRFSSATSRDAHMVGYLLENGADLNVVSAYLEDSIDDAHSKVFGNMLASAQVIEMDGLKIGLCVQPVKSGLTMLASLVAKYKEFKGLDAAFGIFPTSLEKCLVIGRGNPQGINVGSVVRAMGGGGHPGAGSATVKGVDTAAVMEQLMDLIQQASHQDVFVKDIMTDPTPYMVGHDLTMAKALEIFNQQQVNAVMVCDGTKLLGSLSSLDFSKAEQGGRLAKSVKGFTKRQIPHLTAENNSREALDLMNQSKEGLLPVVDGENLVGMVTRTDIILQIYDF